MTFVKTKIELAKLQEGDNLVSNLLQKAGVKVFYGPKEFKAHSKLLLITRKAQGGNFMYYQGDKPNEEEYKIPLAKEKAEMIPLVRQYIQEQQPEGFKLSWTQWKARRR